MSSGGDAGASSSNPPESDCPTSADRLRVQLGPKPAELRPYHAVEGRFAGPHHDGRVPLPRVAEGTQAVLAADGGEQPDRPHVGQREPAAARSGAARPDAGAHRVGVEASHATRNTPPQGPLRLQPSPGREAGMAGYPCLKPLGQGQPAGSVTDAGELQMERTVSGILLLLQLRSCNAICRLEIPE